jgi:hypothetical protein
MVPLVWIGEALTLGDTVLLRCVGLDKYNYVLLLGAHIIGLGSVLAAALVVASTTGTARREDATQFNRLTLARVDNGSNWRVWVALGCWHALSAFELREFWNEWALYCQNRATYDAWGDPDTPKEARYTVRREQVSRNNDASDSFPTKLPTRQPLKPSLPSDTKCSFR